MKVTFCLIFPAAESRASNLEMFSFWHAETSAIVAPLFWHIVAISAIFSEQEELAEVRRLILSDTSRNGPFSILPSNSVLNEFNFPSISLPICSKSPCVADPGAGTVGSSLGE